MNYFEGRTSAGRTVFDPRMISLPVATSPSFPDFTNFIAEGMLKPVLDGINTAAKNLADSITARGSTYAQGPTSAPQPVSPLGHRRHHHHPYHHRECGCGCHEEECHCCHHHKCGCYDDPCHCKCCIVNADLIVYARLGEIRVIPLFLENRWRRERKIATELSQWTTRGGKSAPVKGVLLPPAPEFTLPPCGHQSVTLVVEIGTISREKQEPDVDDCVVAYADLRVQGCDIRPIRIAIAILPRDCEPYEIECGCECCC